MKLAMLLPPAYDERKWTLARQVGVNYAITKAMPNLSGRPAPYDFDALKAIKSDFKEAGFTLYGLEGDQFDMAPIKLGVEGRDELIDKYRQMIRNMGRLDIPLLCYNFMAVIGWYRTKVDIRERGGALVSEFDMGCAEKDPVPGEQQISEQRLWDNLFYFLDAVIPAAEEAGVQMALHPDDPPVSPLRGVGRILTSASSFERVLKKFPEPHHGIAFCQATFKTMGEDIEAVSEAWLGQKRIFFIHLRDVKGDKTRFRETFHDNGPTPMAKMLEHYHQHGFSGPIRLDHAPSMYGERQGSFSGGISVGYEITGKLYAVGYLRGICEAKDIPLE
jgi:mannonate dehydratase